MMEGQDYQRIQDYVTGHLHGAELSAFEAEMQTDQSLNEAVQHFRLEWEIQELMAEDVLRQQIREQFDSLDSPPKPKGAPLRWASYLWKVALALFVLGLGGYFYVKTKENPARTIQTEPTLEQTKPLPETPKATSPEPEQAAPPSTQNPPEKPTQDTKKPKANVPIAKNQAKSPLRPFALAEYKIPNSLTGVRGQNTGKPLDRARDAFFEKNYVETVNLLENLPKEANQEALTLRAHANFNLGLYDAAARDFLALEAGGIYRREAEWFGLLSKMAMGILDSKTAKTALQSIATDEFHPYKENAKKILETMQ